MSEPLKPRIDFSGPLETENNPAFKAQQMFNETEAQTLLRLRWMYRWKMKPGRSRN